MSNEIAVKRGKNHLDVEDRTAPTLLAKIDLSGSIYSNDDDPLVVLSSGGIVSQTHLDEINAERAAKNIAPLSAKPFTLARACIEGLGSVSEGEHLTYDEKMDRHLLALDIKRDNRIALSPEQVTLLKELVGKLYPTNIMGQVHLALDPSIRSRSKRGD